MAGLNVLARTVMFRFFFVLNLLCYILLLFYVLKGIIRIFFKSEINRESGPRAAINDLFYHFILALYCTRLIQTS